MKKYYECLRSERKIDAKERRTKFATKDAVFL
jgi:hypothetical protein